MLSRRSLAALLLGLLTLGACVDNGNVGQQGVLGRGTILGSGEAWAFSVMLDEDRLCTDLYGGGSCFEVPDGTELLYSSGTSGDVAEADPTDGFTCVDGAVSTEVDRVSVLFTNGVEVDAQNIPGPGWAVNFYAVCIDTPSTVEHLTLFDDQDEVLQRSG
ncbi:MAG: hypothetical protein AAF962_17800 [Actinomycetota bacterium]